MHIFVRLLSDCLRKVIRFFDTPGTDFMLLLNCHQAIVRLFSGSGCCHSQVSLYIFRLSSGCCHDQVVVRLWSICGQVVVRLWSGCGQFVVRLSSGCLSGCRQVVCQVVVVRLSSDCLIVVRK